MNVDAGIRNFCEEGFGAGTGSAWPHSKSSWHRRKFALGDLLFLFLDFLLQNDLVANQLLVGAGEKIELGDEFFSALVDLLLIVQHLLEQDEFVPVLNDVLVLLNKVLNIDSELIEFLLLVFFFLFYQHVFSGTLDFLRCLALALAHRDEVDNHDNEGQTSDNTNQDAEEGE